MSTPKEAFVPHKNVPGPARLDVERADNSGAPNTDVQFIADRLAILNHISAYAYLIDEGRWEDWFGLFSDDFSFEVTCPTIGSLIIKGKEPFMRFVGDRYGAKSTAVRRHTQGNIHVASQTATEAKARTYMLISSVPAADQLNILTTGSYNASLEKRDGRWIITRWYIECDAPLGMSKIPEGFTEDEVKFIPDPRAAEAVAIP